MTTFRDTWATSPRERPGLLPSETWVTFPRERPRLLPSVRDLNDFSQERPELLCLIRDPSDSFQRKNQGISAQIESRWLLPEKDQGVSLRERPTWFLPEKDQDASPLRQRPKWLLSEKNQCNSPQTMSWATSHRERRGCLPPDRDLSNFFRKDQGVSLKRPGVSSQRPEWLLSVKWLGVLLQWDRPEWLLPRKTRLSPLRDLGSFSQRKARVSPPQTSPRKD